MLVKSKCNYREDNLSVAQLNNQFLRDYYSWKLAGNAYVKRINGGKNKNLIYLVSLFF